MKQIKLINFNDVETEAVEWLYYPYIPFGKISILCGDPGCGKTTFVLALAALLSKGDNMPLRTNKSEAINILYQTAEDGISDTIVPLLEKFNADKANIATLDNREFNSFSDTELIEKAIVKHNAKLIVFDPLQAFIGSANMSSANDMRNIMRHIGDIASRTGCAVLILCHLNKNSMSSKYAYRLVGSIDITAIARSVLLLTDNPLIENTKLLHPIKNNLAPLGQSLVFRIDKSGVQWLEYCSISERELCGYNNTSDFGNACDMLKELLEHESVKSDKVRAIAAKAGIGFTTLKKAKKHLNIKSIKKGNCWYYEQINGNSGDKG